MVALQQGWRLQSRMLTALRSGDVMALDFLLNLGLDVDSTFRLGGWSRPALCLAVERGYNKLVEMLVARHCSTALLDRDGLSPLHLAAILGHQDIVRILLENRAEVDAPNTNRGDTPLHLAASNRQIHIVRLLVKYGASVDAVNKNGQTPLMYAAAKGDAEAVRALIAGGANIRAVDRTGNTALLSHASSAWLNLEVTQLLCPDNEVADTPNQAGDYPILEIVKSTSAARQECLQALLQRRANLDVVNPLGSTALLLACCNSDWISARMLVRGGGDLSLSDTLGRSAIFIALQNENFLLADAMLAAGGSCKLSADQSNQLGAAANAYMKLIRLNSLKYNARSVVRRVWRRQIKDHVDSSCIPLQLKHYVYYLLE